MQYEFCVIGAGIVGLATARALLRRFPGASLIVVDKERGLGHHQTGRNSGVIHSGIYYAPGSLKAKLCTEGMLRTKSFCREKGILFEERGKLIVATNPLEVERLAALKHRARANGIVVEHLSHAEIAEREPNIVGLEALFVPSAAIVDYKQVLAALSEDVIAAGGAFRMGAQPTSIVEGGDGVELILKDGDRLTCSKLIACAGLQSDRVARLAGTSPAYGIVPFRGEYYRLPAHRSAIVGAMIYPVPDPDLPFLGIHLTPMIDGGVSVGPNAMLGMAREGYGKWSIDLPDVLESARFPGFWRTIFKNLGPGLDELANSVFKRRYLDACRRYAPSLELDDLLPMAAGIRAQAVLADGSLVHDFLFARSERMLHVCNAPSPAATSALPIGDYIADQFAGVFG